MARVIHIIQELTLGGASRAMIAKAKYSSLFGDFKHSIISLVRVHPESPARKLAEANGVELLNFKDEGHLNSIVAEADIVELQWWNSPQMDAFLRKLQPPMRLMAWFHVGGHQAPQNVTKAIVDYVDFAVPCSPYTYECRAIQELGAEARIAKTGMAYGAADFARFDGFKPREHEGFNIGYIGTVHFVKMHPRFVAMSAPINIPGSRFVICGGGSAKDVIKKQAEELGMTDRFQLRGDVEDIKSVIEELDVYGYPLCEETYAAAEVNIQEVMYCGLAPVAFPYGGLRTLIVNDFTGYLVNSELEYRQAIEFLYHHPEERRRMGRNAREYAMQIFGSENAARKFNEYYERLMRKPKTRRMWGGGTAISVLDCPIDEADLMPIMNRSGVHFFIDSLEGQAPDFWTSLSSDKLDEVMAAEKRIAKMSELMKTGGVLSYARFYPKEGYLHLWLGLMLLHSGEGENATKEFVEAINCGCGHWRVGIYLARAARSYGNEDLAKRAFAQMQELHPALTEDMVMSL